jgi:hypothetical protein
MAKEYAIMGREGSNGTAYGRMVHVLIGMKKGGYPDGGRGAETR